MDQNLNEILTELRDRIENLENVIQYILDTMEDDE